MTKVGKRIQDVRRARGLTQSDLAEKVGITPKYLSNIECGDKVPKFETFIAIANALEIDANTLLVDVLQVSPAIISSEIAKKLSSLPIDEQRRLKRIIDAMFENSL